MHRYSLSHFRSICEGASHSNLIPLFLYQREGEKKNNFLLNPPWIHLQCVHMCTYVLCVFVSEPIYHICADIEGRRYFFFAFFPLDLFSNVDVYHFSGPAIHHHSPFFVDNPKGSKFAKMWIALFFFFPFGFTPLPPSYSISVFCHLSLCPVAAQVRDSRAAQSGCNRVMLSLAGGFRSVFGAEMAPSIVCEIHLNRFQIPLIFH